ncbi:MAG: hypothetical protein ACOCYO_03975 [Bacteroidota bacterium]
MVKDKARNIPEGRTIFLGRKVTNDKAWKVIGKDLFDNITIEDKHGERKDIDPDHEVYRTPTLLEKFG